MSTGFVVSFAIGVTPGKWACTWNERMPQHPLELHQASTPLADVLTDSADVALARLEVEPLDESLSVIPLYREAPFVVAPKGHVFEALDSVTLAELSDENPIEVDPLDPNAAVELVAANVGVAVMPQSVARALSRRDVIARPVTDAAETTIALAWLTANTLSLIHI